MNKMTDDSANKEKEVIDFVSQYLSLSKDEATPDTSLRHDLGVDGDDAVEFLQAFSIKFNVDISSIQIEKHFGPERGPGPLFLLYPVMLLLKWLFDWNPKVHNSFIPIKIKDLVDFVSHGRWPITYPTE